MADASDPVTTYLNEIRDRLVTAAITGQRETMVVRDDAPRLLAAIDGVLALVAGAEAWDGRPLDGWALNPATVRAAIADALLGEENADG